ncbi:hypothetical protein LTR56_022017 [Elasticomyces elasticus]|nr:hypothetical protein LTR56_022017 [Elasticomyces elasticus]KAK3635033.1 hypothetical protein LTR22_019389 [Elasticomyces elasticus]KAK4915786.1 hypothetical protein LTR49_016155 [Elasticomyces elasticus]KAK5749448.1 hypothetical protein LTS12_020497 [Elasticomyces elasticus]
MILYVFPSPLSPQATFFVARLDRDDYRFWNNTLKIEYPKCIKWMNEVMDGGDRTITLAKLHVLCDTIRVSLGTDKARSYAPPPLTAARGSGRKTELSSVLSSDEKCEELRATAERVRRSLLRALVVCPIFKEGTKDTKESLLNGVTARVNSDLRNTAITAYQIDTATAFGTGTYLSNLSIGSSEKFAGFTVALTAGKTFTTPVATPAPTRLLWRHLRLLQRSRPVKPIIKSASVAVL